MITAIPHSIQRGQEFYYKCMAPAHPRRRATADVKPNFHTAQAQTRGAT